MIEENSPLWNYLTPSKRILAGDGAFLLADSRLHRDEEPTDYSYLVFPFAKLYEGFLKQLFRDLGIIGDREYQGEFYRIGKALSPGMAGRLREKSAYREIARRFGGGLANRLWLTWKNGRNLIFHYFPDNYHALSYDQAKELITLLVTTMEEAIEKTRVGKSKTEETPV